MKPEFKIKGREATPAEYAQLIQALRASQAATPTARACAADGEAKPAPQTLLDVLLNAEAAAAKQGDHAVYLRTSAFLEGGHSTASEAGQPSDGAPGRYE